MPDPIEGPGVDDVDDVDDPHDVHDLDPIDLDELDPESWRPGLPWRPPIGLVAWLTFIPIVSMLLRILVEDRAKREDPGQQWVLDLWAVAIGLTLVASLLLVIAVPIVTRIVRGRDTWILATTDHGFRIAAVLVIGVIVMHTILAAGLLYGVPYVLLGAFIPSLSAVFLIAGLASVVAFAATAFSALRDQPAQEPAMLLDRLDAPVLHDTILDLAQAIGVDPPNAVVVGPTMDWWTGTSDVLLLEGQVSGTVIHVSLPQLALLSVDEARGILAHELAHRLAGDLEMGQRLGRAHGRVASAISALRSEADGVGRITAIPALAWLDFAQGALGLVVGERRRVSESAADAVAVATVGAPAVATGLLVGQAIADQEDAWAELVQRALAVEIKDPVRSFTTRVRRTLRDVSASDIISDQLLRMGPMHPALLTRLRAIDQVDVHFALSNAPAIGRLLLEPRAVTDRLIGLLRPHDIREEHLELNPPRVTAGAVGWLVTGVVFALIFAYRIVEDRVPGGDFVPIVVIITIIWLLFPVIYPWLQREAVVDQRGIRLRPWWWRWLDPSAERFDWSRIAWSDDLRMTVGFEASVTLTDGATTVTWWAGLWPKAERARLYDALRARGVVVTFTSTLGETDPERHAVLYHLPDRFLLPEIRQRPDGLLLETTKVKSIAINPFKLGFALIDRLHDPVEALGVKDVEGDRDHLASIAKRERADFDAVVQRVVIGGTVSTWTVEVDGEVVWSAPREAVSNDDMDEVVFEVLGLDYAFRQPKEQAPQ